MTDIYLFDVDGTLTPPRQPMAPSFEVFFREFVEQNCVFLISGSDYQKISEQVPLDILSKCAGVYGCSGAEYYEGNQRVHRKMHSFPTELMTLVETFIKNSPYPMRHGTHIELRPGMLNISVPGRKSSLEQRASYHEWDIRCHERSAFVTQLMSLFPDYEASCGGEISIDIVPKGWNKSVVKQEVLNKYPGGCLTFFGDRMGPQGNDKQLADALNTPSARHRAIEVVDYKDTWIHLRHFLTIGASHGAIMRNEQALPNIPGMTMQ